MSRDDLHRELVPRWEASAWLARLEATFTRGLGGSFDADGWWGLDMDNPYPYTKADRLASHQIAERLGIESRDLWHRLAPTGLRARVIRFSGTAARGVTLRDVEAADRAFRRDPLTRVATWFGDGFNEDTGEWVIPDTYEGYVADVKRFVEVPAERPPPMLDLRREWEACARLLK